LIHTGDFKVDPTPTDNRLFDLHAFAEYGKNGVLALFQDSTNVERPGYTPSERAVRRKFEEVFAMSDRRLFVSCFSSSVHRIIPGNEKSIYRMIDHMFRREAKVIYDDYSSPPIHVSGHASQEELKLIINLVRPRYFIPIHGEYRQLSRHSQLAASMHGAVGQVMQIESGEVLEFDELGARN